MEIVFATFLGDETKFHVDDKPDVDGWRSASWGDVKLGELRTVDGVCEVRPFLEPPPLSDEDEIVEEPPPPPWEAHRTLLLQQICAHLTPREVVEAPTPDPSPLERLAAAEQEIATLRAQVAKLSGTDA